MRRRRSSLILLTAALVCALMSAHGLTATQAGDAPVVAGADARTIDATIRDYLAIAPVPGVAVAVTHGADVLLARGYGRTPGGEPIDAHTPMAMASVSKSFTALAVMQLVDAGLVDPDRPVRTYLPEFSMADPRAGAVTVRQLLNQTSGLSDRTFPAFSRPQPRTLRELVAGLRTVSLAGAPGTRWEYHNPNYQVAARLVEVVGGMPFDAYLQRHVFGPLGMRDSRTIDMAADLPASARGHVVVLGFPLAVPEPRAFGNGSGGVLSSAHDMAAWLVMQYRRGRAPDGAEIVSSTSIDAMRTPSKVSGSYALGWVVGTTPSGSPSLSHGGDLFTSTAHQMLLTRTDWGIAIMANTGLAQGDAGAIAARVLGRIEGRPAPPVFVWAQRASDAAMFALAGATLLLAVRGVRRAGTWGVRRTSRVLRTATLFSLIVPLIMLATIHRIVGFLYRGRDVAWIQVPYLSPAFMVLLGVATVAGVAVCCARLSWLAGRHKPAARRVDAGP